jgi:hypothetical protein
MHKFGAQFHWQIYRTVRQHSPTNPIARFQENRVDACGFKFAPGGKAGGAGTNDRYSDYFFILHKLTVGVLVIAGARHDRQNA